MEPTLTKPSGDIWVTLTKPSGEIWLDASVPVLCNMAYILFDVAHVDRKDSVVPYIIYDNVVQPYRKYLCHIPAVLDGCEVLKMTVVFQPKVSVIETLFNMSTPLNPDGTNMSFERFMYLVNDPSTDRYLDMEILVELAGPDTWWRSKHELHVLMLTSIRG